MPTQELERTQLELMNVRKEAQIHISTLKGKISELVHMNSMLGKKVEEQSCLVETRLRRVDDQYVVISSLRTSLNTTVIDSNGAGVGVGDPPQASEGPPVFSIATPQEGLSSASAAVQIVAAATFHQCDSESGSAVCSGQRVAIRHRWRGTG